MDLNRALISIARRAEVRPDRLSESYVEVGVLDTLLQSPDHQVLFGRRGTGKTHVLRVLRDMLEERGDLAILIDMRTIASTGGVLSDLARPITDRATRLLVDVIGAIQTEIADYVLRAAYSDDADFTACMNALDELADELTSVYIRANTSDSSGETPSETRLPNELELSLVLSADPAAHAMIDKSPVRSHLLKGHSKRGDRHDISFSAVRRAMTRVVQLVPAGHVCIILDEWTDTPRELQPVLAEFLRRCLLSVHGLSIKIGAIEERASFLRRGPTGGDYVGFELGSDVVGAADLDDFFCAQHEANLDQEFLEHLIFNHLRSLDPLLVRAKSSSVLASEIFDNDGSLALWVDAAAGVPRDALNIISIAALRAGASRLSYDVMRQAVATWYARDKLGAIRGDADTLGIFSDVIRRVVGENRNSCFLIREPELGNSHLAKLFDARLIHLVRKDIPSDSDVFLRYTLFRVDVGAYVTLPSKSLPKLETRYERHAEYPVLFLPT